MRRSASLFAVALVAVSGGLSACGSGEASSTSAVTLPTVTQPNPAATTSSTSTQANDQARSNAATQSTTTSSDRAVITIPNAGNALPAPGTRAACIKRWAPQFPPGQARQAILSQCRNLPR